jgi:hypothetical protein
MKGYGGGEVQGVADQKTKQNTKTLVFNKNAIFGRKLKKKSPK